ncbi:hypothetical protein [Streptomyces sp. NPDC059262]|uniref:hypothetical protein n=1 Tax=Streptomyces sp. NPDC059262 TaxID=3346797 RepID=UPI00368520F1
MIVPGVVAEAELGRALPRERCRLDAFAHGSLELPAGWAADLDQENQQEPLDEPVT